MERVAWLPLHPYLPGEEGLEIVQKQINLGEGEQRSAWHCAINTRKAAPARGRRSLAMRSFVIDRTKRPAFLSGASFTFPVCVPESHHSAFGQLRPTTKFQTASYPLLFHHSVPNQAYLSRLGNDQRA
jgi:hypothetical protein